MKSNARKLKLFFSFSTLIFLITSCSSPDKKTEAPVSAKPAIQKVEVFIVKTMLISEKVELPGTIIANETTEIHPEISGRLVYLNVNEGKNIGAGTVLARIFDGDLQAQLKKLNIQLAVAQQTVMRMGELLKIGGVSQQEYDLSALQVNTRAGI